jgi:hypothetical protein
MNDPALASSRRLSDLLRREHACLADFLVALAAFDRDGTYRVLGYANLFDYLHRELRLSRAAAHYRKVAARLVARFPEVVEPLRDGRLCITSVVALAKVITDENWAEVLPRFFHCSKQEAREVAAEIAPVAVVPRKSAVTAMPMHVPSSASPVQVRPGEPEANSPEVPHPRTTVEPLTADLRRLHLTVSAGFLEKLKRAKAGQSHVKPGATDEQVLDEALDLLLAQQEKRKASVPPKVKRAVQERDGRCCQWPTHDGGVCGSTVRLEVDHVVPRGRGGADTVENCRVLCKAHNLEAARAAYGDAHMDLFAPRARERVAPWRASHRPRFVASASAPYRRSPRAVRASQPGGTRERRNAMDGSAGSLSTRSDAASGGNGVARTQASAMGARAASPTARTNRLAPTVPSAVGSAACRVATSDPIPLFTACATTAGHTDPERHASQPR